MFSLGRIVRDSKQFHSDHKQLRNGSFHYGFLSDLLGKDKDLPGPIMVLTRQAKPVEEYTDHFNFSLIIADHVHDFVGQIGNGNELDVDSGTDLLAKDYIEYFKNRFSNDGLTLEESITFEPFFYEENSHKLSGWRIPVVFKQSNDHNYCQIPIDDEAVPANNRVVTILNQDGEVVSTLVPGQSYTVVVASGIDEGSSSTSYVINVVDIT